MNQLTKSKNGGTLSFMILDDLEPEYGPVHIKISEGGVRDAVIKLVEPILSREERNQTKYPRYLLSDVFDIDEVVERLLEKGFYRINRYEKYYVIAFAIDYARFEVYSKDCDKKFIKWRNNDTGDSVKGVITDINYNENPVITFFKNL